MYENINESNKLFRFQIDVPTILTYILTAEV